MPEESEAEKFDPTRSLTVVEKISPNLMSGLVQVGEYLLWEDGEMYKTFFSSRWRIITDSQIASLMQFPRFQSSEKWSMVALDEEGRVVMILPGCTVKAWTYCARLPTKRLGNHPVSSILDTTLIRIE